MKEIMESKEGAGKGKPAPSTKKKASLTLHSSKETVAILYDIENSPFEMLNYTLGKARRYQPCRTIVVSDWEARPEQKRWERLMRRPGFTFRQISRTYLGKNSLDSAIYDSAKILYQEGVRKFFIITTDSDFVRIAELLNSETPSYIIGVGTKQASEVLRNAYNEFFVYPPEEKKKETAKPTRKDGGKNMTEKTGSETGQELEKKGRKKEKKGIEKAEKPASDGSGSKGTARKSGKEQSSGKENRKQGRPDRKTSAVREESMAEKKDSSAENGLLSIRLPRSLRHSLEGRREEEGVSMDELITYLLMRGLSQ